MSEINVFRQDTQPTGRKEGDIWLGNGTGAVYMCTDVPGNVWTRLASTPNSTTSPEVGVLTDTCTVATFTDGGSAAGTRVMAGTIPAGAMIMFSKVLVNLGFTGNTSATMTIGDGSDADRYNTSTIDVFTTAATGVQAGVPSGSLLLTAANSPTLTVTGNSDFTAITAGSVTVSVYYIKP